MAKNLFAFSLILLAALSRLLPHPANVAPITALALFGGVYLDRKFAFFVPLLAMVMSDYLIGFHSVIFWVYGSIVAIALLGLWLRKHKTVLSILGATIAGSILFFVVTNFGVWASAQVSYPHTMAGLAQCYVAAIPFFRNTLLGDLAYVGMLFGVFELVRRLIPSLGSEPRTVEA